MSGIRRQAREAAVQILFELDLGGAEIDAVLMQFRRARSPGREAKEFAEALVRAAWSRRQEIDARIQECADNWRLERMAAVDRNVLRLAVSELLAPDPAPAAVILDEAIEIAKRFGNADSGTFVNGVLDAVRKRLPGGAARAGGGDPPG
jgi:transcription antitermination protein NusB